MSSSRTAGLDHRGQPARADRGSGADDRDRAAGEDQEGPLDRRSDAARRRWEWSEPEFLMQGIYGLGIDTRGPAPRLLVSGTSEHWGPGVYRSDDPGRTWSENAGCSYGSPPTWAAVSSGCGRSSPVAPPSLMWCGRGRSRRRCSAPTTAVVAVHGERKENEADQRNCESRPRLRYHFHRRRGRSSSALLIEGTGG